MLDYREDDNDTIPCPLCKKEFMVPHKDLNFELQINDFYICQNPDCKLNTIPIFILPIIVRN